MPKGDAEHLKADTADGYSKIANLLLEAMIAAPLTGIELRILLFVVRRTYGWAKRTDPDSGKADVMTAVDVATGLCVSPRAVEKPLTSLVRNGLLFKVETVPGALGRPCAYGINTHVDDWGSGPDWSLFRTQLREAQQTGAYTLNSVSTIRRIAYRQYAEERSANTLDSVVTGALSPSAASAHEPLTDRTHTDREHTENSSLASARTREADLPEQLPEDLHLQQCEHPQLLSAIEQAQPYWSLRQRQEFFAICLRSADDPNTPVSEDDLLLWLRTDGLKPTNVDRAEGWLRRMLAKRGERERAASRASPRSATVPADRSRFGKGVVG